MQLSSHNKFHPGDIVFVMHKKSFLSRCIAKAMGSKWSHSAIVYGHLDCKTLVCETSLYQVNLDYVDRYIKDRNCSLEVWQYQNT